MQTLSNKSLLEKIALLILFSILSVAASNARAAASEEIMGYLENEKKIADTEGDYLRKSLVMLYSTRSEFQIFKEKGGLDYKSQWRGYEVRAIEALLYTDGKLSTISISLGKNLRTGKLASIENIRVDFDRECNSALELSRRYNRYSGMDVYDGISDLFSCTFAPIGGGVVSISINRKK